MIGLACWIVINTGKEVIYVVRSVLERFPELEPAVIKFLTLWYRAEYLPALKCLHGNITVRPLEERCTLESSSWKKHEWEWMLMSSDTLVSEKGIAVKGGVPSIAGEQRVTRAPILPARI